MSLPRLEFKVPYWLDEIGESGAVYTTLEERMAFAVELARLNVQHGTGGPFGAAIFERESHRLVAPGVNLVVANQCSMLHAEVVAIMLAQRVLNTYDLGGFPGKGYELVTSTEPCAMCLGSVGWSGVTRLVCGARDEDARAVGFDEGIKPAGWDEAYRGRGIEVIQDVGREAAVEVLRAYQQTGGEIYNARQG